MNKNQKIILGTVASVILTMLLFPPFHIEVRNFTSNMGYAFLFHPPKPGSITATVTTSTLLAQWIATLILGGILFFLAKYSSQSVGNTKQRFVINVKKYSFDLLTSPSMVIFFRIYRITFGSLGVLLAGTNFLGLAALILAGGFQRPDVLILAGIAGFLVLKIFRWGVFTVKSKAPPFHSHIDVKSRIFFVTIFMLLIGISTVVSVNQQGKPTSFGEGAMIIGLFLVVGVVISVVVSVVNNFLNARLKNTAK